MGETGDTVNDHLLREHREGWTALGGPMTCPCPHGDAVRSCLGGAGRSPGVDGPGWRSDTCLHTGLWSQGKDAGPTVAAASAIYQKCAFVISRTWWTLFRGAAVVRVQVLILLAQLEPELWCSGHVGVWCAVCQCTPVCPHLRNGSELSARAA